MKDKHKKSALESINSGKYCAD